MRAMKRLAGCVLATAIVLAPGLDAQDLRTRVDAVREGSVRVSYPTRDGVCGWGENISFTSRSDDPDWEADCEHGPARVVMTRRNGRTTAIKTYVGGNWRARADAVDLGSVNAASAAALFFDIAERHQDDEVAGDAMYAAVIADAQIFDRVVSLAQATNRPLAVRKRAAFWVGQIGGPGAVDVLVALLDDDEREMRERAVFALAQTNEERAVRVLRDVVGDESRDRDTRKKAVFWLGQSGGEASPFLRDAFDELTDSEIREQVIFAVSQRKTDENARWLERDVVLDDGLDRSLREKGVFWLGQMGGQTSRLVALYDRLEDQELQEKLIFAFSQSRDEAAIDKLIEIATGNDRAELRRKAIFWLGQTRHPKAIEALAELIGS